MRKPDNKPRTAYFPISNWQMGWWGRMDFNKSTMLNSIKVSWVKVFISPVIVRKIESGIFFKNLLTCIWAIVHGFTAQYRHQILICHYVIKGLRYYDLCIAVWPSTATAWSIHLIPKVCIFREIFKWTAYNKKYVEKSQQMKTGQTCQYVFLIGHPSKCTRLMFGCCF